MNKVKLQQAIQANCDLSDARDNGIYSVCTLVLKLRNHFKWENSLPPWEEPESAVLLDWIGARETYWEEIRDREFQSLPMGTGEADPYEIDAVNRGLESDRLLYGAGYGRSMKAVFFLAEKVGDFEVKNCPVIILGRELARELASPFAMLQDNVIYIRREALRFYFWDQIQEIRCSGKSALRHALKLYGVLAETGEVERPALVERFDEMVEREMGVFIYHEVGERYEDGLDSATLKRVIGAFPASPVELVARALKDVLADTNEHGLLSHVIAAEQESSLGFYVAFLDGLRKVLFPEIGPAFERFALTGDWREIDRARRSCRAANLARAEKLVAISRRLQDEPLELLKAEAETEILLPLGLVQR